jgi:hypothetical protein
MVTPGRGLPLSPPTGYLAAALLRQTPETEKEKEKEKEKPRSFERGFVFLVGRAGVEPTTNGLKVRCSTN